MRCKVRDLAEFKRFSLYEMFLLNHGKAALHEIVTFSSMKYMPLCVCVCVCLLLCRFVQLLGNVG